MINLKTFRQPIRDDRRKGINRTNELGAYAVLELARQESLRLDEIAVALLGLNTIVLRNQGGPANLPDNLRSLAQQMVNYARVLDARQAQPTDEIMQ